MTTPEDKPNQPVNTVLDAANQIWLAGLGAFAKTQEEGSRVFEALVKEGETVEARTMKVLQAAGEKVEEVKGKATEQLDKLEQAFQDRVARALNRLGVPTNEDIQELTKRVEALNDSVQKLLQEATTKN